jgi:hypothetical protein
MEEMQEGMILGAIQSWDERINVPSGFSDAPAVIPRWQQDGRNPRLSGGSWSQALICTGVLQQRLYTEGI